MKRIRKLIIILGLCLLATVAFSVSTFAAKKPKLNKKKATIYVGKTLQLKVKNAKGKKVKWKSSNKKVATVSKKGKVKGKKPGKTTITATVGKKKLKCKVTVQPKKSVNPTPTLIQKPKLSVSEKKITISGLDEKIILVTYTGDKTIAYESSNPNVATGGFGEFNGNEIPFSVYAKRDGNATISIYEKGGDLVNTIEITVENAIRDRLLAYGVYDLYSKAKFPSTLHIKKAYYEKGIKNGYGDIIDRVVIEGYAGNGYGGFSSLYVVEIRAPQSKNYADNDFVDISGDRYFYSVHGADPGLISTNSVYIDSGTIKNVYNKYWGDKAKNIAYD